MVTGEGLVTEAVKVTTVPEVTEEPDESGPEEDDSVSVVAVVIWACATDAASMAMAAIIAPRRIAT